jgi:hypothetical protein
MQPLAILAAMIIATTPVAEIQRICAKKWPTEYRLRGFCEDTHLKALQQIERRKAPSSAKRRTKAAQYWTQPDPSKGPWSVPQQSQ